MTQVRGRRWEEKVQSIRAGPQWQMRWQLLITSHFEMSPAVLLLMLTHLFLHALVDIAFSTTAETFQQCEIVISNNADFGRQTLPHNLIMQLTVMENFLHSAHDDFVWYTSNTWSDLSINHSKMKNTEVHVTLASFSTHDRSCAKYFMRPLCISKACTFNVSTAHNKTQRLNNTCYGGLGWRQTVTGH